MQGKEENLELTGNLHQEFEEMKKFPAVRLDFS